ncbi:hypothetical protein BCR34DRAFT_637708 [Clohesyomyces aquaticus]|uniref:Uncharacterized protein n=1 Tax=Clohesyomyces aquaticus TaxID=1231657 RepID=A0A1Y1YST2_9PLEO|nr:hypothetical protein BCR34DRAFT_637708 [Clohesyomyces aquaticus]
MSIFDKQGIPRWLLQQTNTSQLDFDDALTPLLSFSLVRTEIETQALTMHRLGSILALSAVFPSGDYSTWEQCRVLLPHLKEMVGYRIEDKEGLEKQADSASKAGWYLLLIGEYTAAEGMFRLSLDTREKVLGVEHPDTLTSVSNLGSVLERQGKYEEAEAMHRRALEGYEKVLGREHPRTLTSVYHLAFLFHQKRDYSAAVGLYQRAYDGYVKVLGVEHPTAIACFRHYESALQNREA